MNLVKPFAILLSCALLLCGAAFAESDATVFDGGTVIAENESLSIDLDGDGTAESLLWAYVGNENDQTLRLTLTPASGDALTYDTDIQWGQQVGVIDLDGDGAQEIFLSGDVMSDDYYTYCLRYRGGALYPLLFADASRGENTNGYYMAGYGAVTYAGKGVVTMAGSQDVLGTRFAARTFKLSIGDRFELNDCGLWTFLADTSDPDTWEYGCLTVKQAFDATFDEGGAGQLQPGDKLIITYSDKESIAGFATQDGRTGILAIGRDYERGWGYRVNDVPEDDLFETVPYAD